MKGTNDIHIAQSKFTVDCPRWLRKRIRKNLKAAARNKVNPVRAKKALQILVFNKKKQKT